MILCDFYVFMLLCYMFLCFNICLFLCEIVCDIYVKFVFLINILDLIFHNSLIFWKLFSLDHFVNILDSIFDVFLIYRRRQSNNNSALLAELEI